MKKSTFLTLMVMLLALKTFGQDPTVVNWEVVPTPLTLGALPMTASGQEVWADFNNDGNLDFFITAGQGGLLSALYKSNGDGTYTEILTEATSLAFSSAIFFDYNNDGNLDLLIAGSADGTTTAVLTELYENTGAPNYELLLKEDAFFVGISAEGGDNNTRLIEAVDYNNDGWVDLFISGNAGGTWDVSGSARVVALYKNNHGSFELQTTPVDGTSNFVSMNGGGIHSADINNDGNADMIVSGYVDGTLQTVTDLYLNKGDGTFSYFQDSRNLFKGQMQGETGFVDVNNDGFMDIIEVGRDVNNGWSNFANLFINNKDLSFTKLTESSTNLVGGGASLATGDINNDGLTDIALSGWGPNMTFFYNKGDNSFLSNPINPDSARARAGSINFVDFTKDGNLDFAIFGYRDGGDGTSGNPVWPNYILENKLGEGIASNQAPASPTNLILAENGSGITLSWDASTDDNTPSEAIRYNVYAKSNSGEIYTFFPADPNTGFLKANSCVRPLISGTSISLKGMNAANYTFGVQAIDNALTASAFATFETVGIEKNYDLKFSVYGQAGEIKIINNHNLSANYSVYSITGQKIVSGVIEGYNTAELKISVAGIYLVKVNNGFSNSTSKIFVK